MKVMRIKIIGFKVGVARPTYNKTVESGISDFDLGSIIYDALEKSDFLSIRKVE
jgi:hypothetical protein